MDKKEAVTVIFISLYFFSSLYRRLRNNIDPTQRLRLLSDIGWAKEPDTWPVRRAQANWISVLLDEKKTRTFSFQNNGGWG